MELRDYQQECVNAINNMESGSALVSMATGLGKTVVFSRIKRRGRVLILSHREELVHQPIKYYDCKCGVEQGKERSSGEEVVSASVQSLVRRLSSFKPDDFDMIITDEAHHAAAPTYKKIYAYFKPRLHVGFTATPNRGDKVRLDDVFDEIIFERNLKWGISNDYLTDIMCFRAKISCDLRRVKLSGGDFMPSSLDEAINTTGVNKEIAKVYQKYAKGQTLIFATSVNHAENIAREIDGAVVVSQSTKNRDKIIEDFTNRKIKCIVNCMIFTEGTDMPLIETIIIARPTKNPSLYTQMVGRGLRKYTGKQYLTLIDCVGVTEKHDICTAPTLMGLDMENVPKSRLDKIEGLLTEMPSIVDSALDCPENWILNIKAVELFAREQKVNLRTINWTKKANGDLVYQFAGGDRIGIKAINELGKTKVMYYLYDNLKEKFCYSESAECSLQEALNLAYAHFITRHEDEKPLWCLDNYLLWQGERATEKQIAYIKGKLSNEDFDYLLKNHPLTKGNAAQIINMLRIKDNSPTRLLRLRKKEEEKKKEKEEKYEQMSALKIKTLFSVKRPFKYYAIKHPTDLVITDSWDLALQIIEKLDGENEEKCRYKKFPSKAQAIEFLRKRD